MSELSNALEGIVGDMGMSMPDSPEETNPEQEVQENTTEDVQTEEPPQEKTEEPIQQVAAEQQPESSLQEEEVSDEEMETAMLDYLSERLGRQVSSFDEIKGDNKVSTEIDERVAAINEFVSKTGRDPQDWFKYQAMNPSEMDDLSAVRTQLSNQYSDLSESDLNLLFQSKYKLDADLYEDGDVRLSQIQLKIDADKARQEIEGIRSEYAAPVKEVSTESESFVNDEWLSNMSTEVDALEGIEFEVSKDKSFTFGLEDSYKNQLKSKNENIEDFFSTYSSEKGQWDFEKWNMHQAVLDNIETIVKTAYQQGLGEGQRGLVDKAANVQFNQPNSSSNSDSDTPNIEEQIKNALGMNDDTLSFKI